MCFTDEPRLSAVIWVSGFTSLLSVSVSLATVFSENTKEQLAGAVAIFLTLGSRLVNTVSICTKYLIRVLTTIYKE